MDIELHSDLTKASEVLRSAGLEDIIIKGDRRLEAKLRRGPGRIHVLGLEMGDGKVYLDVHWDFFIHLIFLGVDYAKRPREICEKIVGQASRNGIKAEITDGRSWFTRRNKAIFTGIRM